MLLASCGRDTTGSGTIPEKATLPEPSAAAATEAEKHYSADGIELLINMAGYSDNAKLYTANDIYLLSFECGYISGPHPEMLVIEDQEQLECARERYGLALPEEGLTADELWYYNTSISEPFNEMTEKYPVSDYTYVVQYDEVCNGGYSLRVGALLVDENIMHFVETADSKWPDPDGIQTDVMGGFCYMAAVPKGMLPDTRYEAWEYPETEETERESDTPEEGYFAVFHGGAGEKVYETYVYAADGGYRYVNVTATTVSWGSSQWNYKITGEGEADTADDVIRAAEENGAGQFVIYVDDPGTVCEISGFTERAQ